MIFHTLSWRKCSLLKVLITALAFVSTGALQLDLNDTCSGNSLYYCTLTNLTSSFGEPLVWITKSPANQLNELLIYDSVLGRLPSLVFELAPKLHVLIMHNCAVNSIMSMDFAKALQLHKLVLQKNRLFIIPERVFASMFALEELYLSHNTIHMIHRYGFARLPRLRYLDLQENGIRTLPDGVFEDLINVEHIDLSFNELESINVNTFAKNLKLNTLLLSENKFSVFEPNSLMHLKHLNILDLSNTLLEELQLQSVDLLMVQGSKLKRCTISGSVIKVNAANNDLRGITIQDKMAVRELELHGNLLESLDDIVGMLNLQKLDVSKNQLVTLKTSHSPMYLPLPNLMSLNLASNRLQNLTADNFVFLLKLKTLDLAFNHFIRLDSGIFKHLVNLEKFYIEGNRLFEFNYVEFREMHTFLHEVGVFENDWEFRYIKHMLNYFRSHGIRLPMRFTPADSGAATSSSYRETTESSVLKSSPLSSNSRSEVDDVDILNDMNHARQSSRLDTHAGPYHPSKIVGVSGIHPYWTMRDILALVTLIIVLLILLLQFFRILQEEHCLPVWCRCCLGLGSSEAEPLRPRHRPLLEDTSIV